MSWPVNIGSCVAEDGTDFRNSSKDTLTQLHFGTRTNLQRSVSHSVCMIEVSGGFICSEAFLSGCCPAGQVRTLRRSLLRSFLLQCAPSSSTLGISNMLTRLKTLAQSCDRVQQELCVPLPKPGLAEPVGNLLECCRRHDQFRIRRSGIHQLLIT